MPNHYQIVQIGVPILTSLNEVSYDQDDNLLKLKTHLPEKAWSTLRVGGERDYLRWKEKSFVLMGEEDTDVGSCFITPSMTSNSAPCIDPEVEVAYDDKASSYAPAGDLRTVIEGFNGELPMGGGFVPVIGVCDSNSFHNVSYILSCSAFTRAVASFEACTDYMVLNFDFHNDNSSSVEYVSSDGWGGQAKHWVETLCRKNYQYTVVGLGGIKVQNLVPKGEEWAFANSSYDLELDIYREFSLAMNERAPDLANTCVYISIDRDVLGTQYTQWSTDSKIPFDDLHEAMVRSIAHLISRGAKIIGFDITGFPVRKEAADHSAEVLPSSVKADITRLIRTAEHAIELSLSTEAPMRTVRARMTELTAEPEVVGSPIFRREERISLFEEMRLKREAKERRQRERLERIESNAALLERREEIRIVLSRSPRIQTMDEDVLHEYVCTLLERE